MTILITPTPEYPLAFWLRQVQGYLLTSNVDGVTRLVVEV